MPIYSKHAASAKAGSASLTYITIGALLAIWSAVWYFAATPESRWANAVILGLFLTGVTFLAIGFGIGRIGREARKVELPPKDESGRPVQVVEQPASEANV